MAADLVDIGAILRESVSLDNRKRREQREAGYAVFTPSKSIPTSEIPKDTTLSGNQRGKSIFQFDRLSATSADITKQTAIDVGALGFMARAMVQTTLPHRQQPGDHYSRTDGDLTVSITALSGGGLPYGSYPRLILIWMTTEAVRTGKRELELGHSLSQFMARLGLQPTGGNWGTIPRFRDQMHRLLGAAISTRWAGESHDRHRVSGTNLLLADTYDLWWTPQEIPSKKTPSSHVALSQGFFDQIVASPVPLDLRAVRALKRSPLALDLYAWATRRVSYLNRPVLVSWRAMRLSFGVGYAETPQGRSRFRSNAIDALRRISVVYPELRWQPQERGLILRPSLVHVAKLPR